ncbi:MAG: response regulator [Mongoliibacter sp.]|nr:MAG: response regulator [Mongoliibacter sp.]
MLEQQGCEFVFTHSLQKALSDTFDYLFVSDLSLPRLIGKRYSKVDFLKKLREEQNCPIIFLSGNDSTGPIFPEIVDQVDLYLSKQLLRDKTIYLQPLKRHFFRDQMMSQFKFKNENSFEPISLSKGHLHKISVSWNLALIDWKVQMSGKLGKFLNILNKNSAVIPPEPVCELQKRSNKIMFKGNLFPGQHDVFRLHRLLTLKVFKTFDFESSYKADVILGPKAYLAQMKETIISLSPFGWGEICYRDFETFRTGSLLFKPDMSHIETYPDIYQDDNHLSYRWDAKDLKAKIEKVLKDPAAFQKIAEKGKTSFENAIDPKKSGAAFSKHFFDILNMARDNFENR